jgi:DNA-binding protein H-NS
MATYSELMTQANALVAQAEAARAAEKVEAIAHIRKTMKDLDVAIAEVAGYRSTQLPGHAPDGPVSKWPWTARGKSKANGPGGKTSRPARFKGPLGELWSGVGRRPDWLKQALAQGKKVSDFEIAGNSSTPD